MKRRLAWILSFYILLSALVPCDIFDNCEGGTFTTQTTGSQDKKACTDCSPFSTCCATHVLTVPGNCTIIEPIKIFSPVPYGDYKSFFQSGYFSSLLQPPRVG